MTDRPPFQPTPPTRHRFHFLDALRGVAAVAVVLYHLPFSLGLRNVVPNGFLAVDFFFCLSGFVIAFSYQNRLQNGLRFGDFFVMRLIRLYPVYALGTILGLVIFFLTVGLKRALLLKGSILALFLASILLLPGGQFLHSRDLFPLDSPAWSLFYELLINLAFAWLLIRGLANRWLLGILVFAAAALLFWWGCSGHTLDAGYAPARNHIGIGIARVTMSFISGTFLFRASRRWPRPRIQGGSFPFALTCLLMFLLSSPFAPMQTGVFQFLAAALVFPLVVYLGSLVEPPATSVRACIILGELSYPVYLLHDPILSLLYMPTIATLISRSLPSKLLTVLLTLVIASAISYFVGTRLDAPLRKFLSRWYFPRGKQNAPQTPVACLSNTIALQGTHDD